MAMTDDSAKRKEPEPETDDKKNEDKMTDQAAPEGKAEKTEQKEPDAKKQKKSAEPDAAAVRKQVEYYFSDENLRHDKFFHEKISEQADGWLDMTMILSCNKMKAMNTTMEIVVEALKGSSLELKDGGKAIRRPGNAALPKLEERQLHGKKNSAHAHDGGVMAVFKNIPEEQSWVQVKEKLKAAMPEKACLWFVSEVSDKNSCFVATAPFDGDVQFFEKLELDLGGGKAKAEVCQGDALQQGLKLLPRHIRERREKESRKRQKERNKPIQVGSQKFVNIGALRGRVKEILNSRADGEMLKAEGSDFKLIKALLEFHPKGAEKSAGLSGIKVATSTQGDNRCFFMVKEDGTSDDFSAKKCLDAIEKDPPYVKSEVSQPPAAAASTDAPKEGEPAEKKPAEGQPEEKKPAEGQTDEQKPAEGQTDDKKPEEKKEEEKKE